MSANRCSVCGKPWVGHLGVIPLCAEVMRLRQRNRLLERAIARSLKATDLSTAQGVLAGIPKETP